MLLMDAATSSHVLDISPHDGHRPPASVSWLLLHDGSLSVDLGEPSEASTRKSGLLFSEREDNRVNIFLVR